MKNVSAGRPLAMSSTFARGLAECPARAVSADAIRRTKDAAFMASDNLDFGNVVHEVMEAVHDGTGSSPREEFEKAWARYDIASTDYYEMGMSKIDAYVERSMNEKGRALTMSVEWRFLLDANDMRIFSIADDDELTSVLKSEFGEESVPVTSTIDRVDFGGDGVSIYDYKTNRLRFPRWEVDNSLQLGLYALAMRALDYEVEKCAYDMFHFGFEYVSFSDEKLEVFRRMLVDLWKKCAAWEEDGWPERVNKYCGWCHRKAECSAFDAAMRYGGGIVPQSLEQAVGMRKKAKRAESAVRSELRSLDDVIVKEMTRRGEFAIETLEGRVVLKTGKRTYYDPVLLLQGIGAGTGGDPNLYADLMECVTVNKSKTDKVLRRHGLSDEERESFLYERDLSPSVAIED